MAGRRAQVASVLLCYVIPGLLGPIAETAGWFALWATAAAVGLAAFALAIALRRLESASGDPPVRPGR